METSGLKLTLLTAVVGVIGTGIGASLQGYRSSKLEQQKFEAQLISDALENPNRVEAAKALTFLLDIGLLDNLNESRIRDYANSPESLPLFFHKGIKDGLVSVEQAKRILLSVGDYSGEINEVADIEFPDAVKRFQKQNGLIEDGELGPATARALLSLSLGVRHRNRLRMHFNCSAFVDTSNVSQSAALIPYACSRVRPPEARGGS